MHRPAGLLLLAAALAAGCDRREPLEPQAALQAAAMLAADGPDYLQAAAGAVVQPRVRLLSGEGAPQAGVPVRWTIQDGGGSLDPDPTFTDADGYAMQSWTLGTAGFQTLKAIVRDAGAVVFTGNALLPGGSVSAQSGEAQEVQLGDAAVALVAVAASGGGPVAGAAVRWAVVAGSGRLRHPDRTTDGAGRAGVIVVPEAAGAVEVQARVGGHGVASFMVTALDGSSLVLDTVVSGLIRPLYAAAPPGDDRLFIVEEPGRILVFDDGALLPTPFLDLRAQVSDTGEQGMPSLAFHPDFALNGYVFVNYTDLAGDTRVVRYTVAPGASVADPGSAKLILTIDQPFTNHNGGHMLFGPDGRLWIASGDGGGARDPNGNGQNRATLLGKLLRINVDVGPNRGYAAPRDNPFFGDPSAAPEIWAYGLRNPWRFAFDEGQLYIADVGQRDREEINVVRRRAAGLNFGWNVVEGTLCLAPGCDTTGMTPPVLEYDHDDGCSVIGGFVYRGSALPEIRGHYFYADFCGGWVRSFRYRNGVLDRHRQYPFGTLASVTSFGVDGAGELYIVSRAGHVMRIARP